MSGYEGLTFLSFFGSLICPPTRTACGGGGASGNPPTTPPTTPPGTPPSTPPGTPPSTPRSIPSSGLTSSGVSIGAWNLFSVGTGVDIGLGWVCARGAGGGGGGGGGGGAAGSTKNAFTTDVGSGSSPEGRSGKTQT